jgi:hypothetical protein
MLVLRVALLASVFWLFHRLRHGSPYSERSAFIASIIWGLVVVFLALMIKGLTMAAFISAALSILVATCILYLVQFLDTTVFWIIGWPLGFVALLLFS